MPKPRKGVPQNGTGKKKKKKNHKPVTDEICTTLKKHCITEKFYKSKILLPNKNTHS